MKNKFKIQDIILNQKNIFTYNDIFNSAKEVINVDDDYINGLIRDVLRIYIKNGIVLIDINGYKLN